MPRAAAILPIRLAIALIASTLIAGAASPAQAQRGGFHSSGGFHGGGFASRPAAPSRSFGGFSGARPGFSSARPVGPARFGGPAHFPGAMPTQPRRAFAPSSNLRMRAPGGFGSNFNARRPEYGVRRPEYPGNGYSNYDHRHHPHRPEYNYGGTTLYTGTILPYGYPYYGYGFGDDLGFPYLDTPYDDGSGYSDQSSYPQNSYAPDYGDAYNDSNNYVADSAPEAAEPPPAGQPTNSAPYSYGSPQPPAAQSAALPQDSVTLIFNNGAPARQIHNYILSRDTLTVLDGPRREIPVSTLDLAATEQANRSAGIDFHLPAAR